MRDLKYIDTRVGGIEKGYKKEAVAYRALPEDLIKGKGKLKLIS